jgi:bidirectional [NiFe] hydrogenase diaphorase subunit
VPRPPYPAQKGLYECPTLINNVETLANITHHHQPGADWYASIGTENSKGTKIFALTGKIRNTGLIEVPMGTSLRRIVEEMGGGVPDGGESRPFRPADLPAAVFPSHLLDTPVSYESLKIAGLHDGLRRHDRDGRNHQHGGNRPLLHGVLPGRNLR